jgi:hypothetical protein
LTIAVVSRVASKIGSSVTFGSVISIFSFGSKHFEKN